MAKTLDRVAFHGLRFEGKRFDCGSKEGFLEANIAFALERADLRGATAEILERYARNLADDTEGA
jgi:UTP--glucose-1-phosphate uridylyltransferase